MKAIFKIFVLLFLLLFNSESANSAICTALANGNWSNPANWSCGSVPSCGDLILIPSGITINVDTQVDLDENSSPACSTATFIVVFGTLQFVTGFKISLACGSGVDIMPGGSMLPGGGGGSSNWLKICDIVEWQTSHGPVIGFKHFGSPIPLPVEFLSFSVGQSGNGVKLEWVVASERENDFFTIEISNDGVNWIEFDNVNSIGDHTNEYTYKREFENLEFSSLSYFKLSQTDKNGIRTFLDTKSIAIEQNTIVVYPNPASVGGQLNITIESESDESTDLYILNSIGQMVNSEIINLIEGRNKIVIETVDMEKGIYFIKMSSAHNNEMYKIILN